MSQNNINTLNIIFRLVKNTMRNKKITFTLIFVAMAYIVGSCSLKTSKTIEEELTKEKLITTKKAETQLTIKEAAPLEQSEKLKEYCHLIDKKFNRYKWGKSQCDKIKWTHVRDSYLGRPLIWTVFNNRKNGNDQKMNKNLTLILCGVHGDEITPVKFCFDIIYDLYDNPELFQERTVVVAPIVTPDSFFKKRPTRTNHRGVDVNRNFPTKKWSSMALKLWKQRYNSDKRRYPGEKAYSEAEVVFQMNLVKRYKPGKIISVHAPLTLIDYDGPGDDGEMANSKSLLANQLLIQMSMKAKGYRIKNYPFYVGSLGNWAGNERNIPTFTLELPTIDYTKHKRYWKRFQSAIHSAIRSDVLKPITLEK